MAAPFGPYLDHCTMRTPQNLAAVCRFLRASHRNPRNRRPKIAVTANIFSRAGLRLPANYPGESASLFRRHPSAPSHRAKQVAGGPCGRGRHLRSISTGPRRWSVQPNPQCPVRHRQRPRCASGRHASRCSARRRNAQQGRETAGTTRGSGAKDKVTECNGINGRSKAAGLPSSPLPDHVMRTVRRPNRPARGNGRA